MSTAGRALALMFAAIAAVGAQSASPSGQRVGFARVPGQALLRIDVTLDSTAGAWTGTLTVPAQKAQMSFVSTSRVGDSLFATLPAAGQGAVLRMRFAADGAALTGSIVSFQTGTITLRRAGTPEAAWLLESTVRVDQSRTAANRMIAQSGYDPK